LGYPMTFGRFINRNGLRGDGRYLSHVNLEVTSGTTLSPGEATAALAPHWRAALINANAWYGRMVDDLRRLERDGQDEDAVCRGIAARTGVDADVVAIVLKEFLSW
jgi:hypothetical protein